MVNYNWKKKLTTGWAGWAALNGNEMPWVVKKMFFVCRNEIILWKSSKKIDYDYTFLTWIYLMMWVTFGLINIYNFVCDKYYYNIRWILFFEALLLAGNGKSNFWEKK